MNGGFIPGAPKWSLVKTAFDLSVGVRQRRATRSSKAGSVITFNESSDLIHAHMMMIATRCLNELIQQLGQAREDLTWSVVAASNDFVYLIESSETSKLFVRAATTTFC